MNKIDQLLELIQKNPNLPIIPMVDGEIPEDNCGWWIGEWGVAHVDEYLLMDTEVVFKNDHDVFYVLERYLSDDEYDNLPETEAECMPYYDSLPWIKAIIVYIDLPDQI